MRAMALGLYVPTGLKRCRSTHTGKVAPGIRSYINTTETYEIICNTAEFVSGHGSNITFGGYVAGNFTWVDQKTKDVLKTEIETNSSVLTFRNFADSDAGNYSCVFSYNPILGIKDVIWTIAANSTLGW